MHSLLTLRRLERAAQVTPRSCSSGSQATSNNKNVFFDEDVEPISPKFCKSSSEDGAESKVEEKDKEGELFYSDIGSINCYIPAAGLGIANQEFNKSIGSQEPRGDRSKSQAQMQQPNQLSTPTMKKRSILSLSANNKADGPIQQQQPKLPYRLQQIARKKQVQSRKKKLR